MSDTVDVLLCTVGTSLLGNLKRLAENNKSYENESPKDPIPNQYQPILKAYLDHNYVALTHEFQKMEPDTHLLGAKTNSIYSIFPRIPGSNWVRMGLKDITPAMNTS